jgi:hypothetical protein
MSRKPTAGTYQKQRFDRVCLHIFTMAKRQKQPKCPHMDKQINKICCIRADPALGWLNLELVSFTVM